MKPFKYLLLSLLLVIPLAACGTTAQPTATPTVASSSAAPNTVASSTDTPATVPTTAPTTASQPTTAPTNSPSAPTQPSTNPTTEPSTNPTTQPPPNNTFSLDIESLATDLRRPVLITNAGDGSGRLFVVEQPGTILVYQNGAILEKPFLRIGGKITTAGNEQGLLGLAFDPDYKNNGLLYVNYSAKANGDNIVERYKVSADPNVVDPASAKILLTIPGFEPNHNSGMLAFGPDGYLYIGTGDGGGAGDQHGTIGNAQSLDSLNGKILRIDVNADTYKVPADNPFVNTPNAKPEIWAYGLRNPWRFSFDKATGDLYIGDVGQSSKEEIDFQLAGDKGGENYGWRIIEGDECYDQAQNCDTPNLIAPISFFSHDLGCSVTGGNVYRGKAYPWLVGQYIYADYCTGIIWATARDASGKWQTRQVTTFDDTISSFGQGEDGELYVAGHKNGTLYKLTSSK